MRAPNLWPTAIQERSAGDAAAQNAGLPELRSESVLLAMFSSLPEPPTQNAILMLKRCFGRVVFLRNNMTFPADFYLDAPELKEVGSPCSTQAARRKNAFWKLARFARYVFALRRELGGGRYRLVIIHDYLALLAFWLVRKSAGYRGLVWFNSYDVIDPENARPARFSLQRWVVARHEELFGELDFFSLPTAERKPYYPLHRVKREVFVIPNYPAVTYYKRFQQPRRAAPEGAIRLIYMGALGRGHGFEEIIRSLATPVAGRNAHLVLKGWIEEDYRRELLALAAQCGVSGSLQFAGFGPYPKVGELAASCTVGLALFTGKDIMNRTLGTASNKIYEYAAVGLPVLLFDTPYFRSHFEGRAWAFFTDLSQTSLRLGIEAILSRYEEASAAAVEDFRRGFNYEDVFTPALRRVVDAMAEPVHG